VEINPLPGKNLRCQFVKSLFFLILEKAVINIHKNVAEGLNIERKFLVANG
jgi:hypothetical protein